jgi:hypothetical protein
VTVQPRICQGVALVDAAVALVEQGEGQAKVGKTEQGEQQEFETVKAEGIH